MNYRFYAFVLSPLSSIQKGIQAGHCAVNLIRDSNMYFGKEQLAAVWGWAYNDETFIILDGGSSAELDSIYTVVEENDFPFETFEESKEFLCGLRTCVGVVLPERVYAAALNEEKSAYEYNEFGPNGELVKVHSYPVGSNVFDLLTVKNSRPLAI